MSCVVGDRWTIPSQAGNSEWTTAFRGGFNRSMQHNERRMSDGALQMKQRCRIYYSESQRALMWERWGKGESLRLSCSGCPSGLPDGSNAPGRASRTITCRTRPSTAVFSFRHGVH